MRTIARSATASSCSHAGYEGNQTRKHLRNLPLLEEELKVDPDNLFNLHHFARVLEGLGRADEAEVSLTHAVDVAREMGPDDPIGSLMFGELVRLRRDRGDETEALLEEARSRYPGNYLLLFHEGRQGLDNGRYEDAVAVLDRLLAVDKSRLADEGPSYDEAIFGALAHESRALCFMRLERYEEAAAAYADAERCAPDDRSLAAKRELALARARS